MKKSKSVRNLLVFVLFGLLFSAGFLIVRTADQLRQMSTARQSLESLSEEQNLEPAGQYLSNPVCDLDAVLNIDLSRSMTRLDQGHQKIWWAHRAMEAFVDKMRALQIANPGHTIRVGLTQFSGHGGTSATVVQSLTSDLVGIVRPKISTLNYEGPATGTCIACGILAANHDFAVNSTGGQQKIQIVMSDGCGNRLISGQRVPIPVARPQSTAAANQGRTQGITYFTVGYSGEISTDCGNPQYDEATLLGIANDPDSAHHFYRPDVTTWTQTFEDLAEAVFANCSVQQCKLTSPSFGSHTVGTTPTVNFVAQNSGGYVVPQYYSARVDSGINVSPSSGTGWNPNSPYNQGFTLSGLDASDTTGIKTLHVEGRFGSPGGAEACSTDYVFSVTPGVQNWFRAWNSGIFANGNITSVIPSTAANNELILASTGNSPATVVYGGLATLGNGTFSQSTYNWNALSRFTGTLPDYNFFANKINFDASSNISSGSVAGSVLNSGGQLFGDYYIYRKSAGSLDITGNLDLQNRKIILFVNGDLNIKGKINLNDGRGFFMAIVSGNITVDPDTVGGSNPDLEGIYFVGGEFRSESKTTGYDTVLRLRGMVTSMNNFVLKREVSNPDVQPAEVFTYAPDQYLLYPKFLGLRYVNWQEVAP